jgi:hypothetical protein
MEPVARSAASDARRYLSGSVKRAQPILYMLSAWEYKAIFRVQPAMD